MLTREMAFAGNTGINIQLDALINAKEQATNCLFNEELGAVLQIEKLDFDLVKNTFAKHNLADCLHFIGYLNNEKSVCISYAKQILLQEELNIYHAQWSKTSYHLQKLRDNPKSADSEFSAIEQAKVPAIAEVITNQHRQAITKPTLASSAAKVAILREQGVNGHIEMAAAFARAGFTAVDVHMTDLITGRHNLQDYIGLVACGGFSYGDVLGAGSGWANSILFNDKLRDMFSEFLHALILLPLGYAMAVKCYRKLKA